MRCLREACAGRRQRLVALTGWGQENDRALAFAAGFELHPTKRVDAASLRAVFAEAPPPSGA